MEPLSDVLRLRNKFDQIVVDALRLFQWVLLKVSPARPRKIEPPRRCSDSFACSPNEIKAVEPATMGHWLSGLNWLPVPLVGAVRCPAMDAPRLLRGQRNLFSNGQAHAQSRNVCGELPDIVF
ncbi:hypothetical protein [Paraburkholderia graminis]|uniref:hypothetical protein n=1 Tax=Paraburkholderia graminis TaxID=60548 RepID=UPI0038BD9B34